MVAWYTVGIVGLTYAGSTHLTRPRPDKEAEVFNDWLIDPKKDLEQLAEKHQVPRSTIFDWANRYDWRGQLKARVESVIDDTILGLGYELPALVDRLVSIAKSPEATNRDAINAVKALLPYVVRMDQAPNGGDVYVDKMLVIEAEGMTTADLMRQSAAILEDNIGKATEQRVAKRQQLPKNV